MTNEKIIQMIDEYLEEPHSINKDWVEALQTCKQALLDNAEQKAEIERLEFALYVQKVFDLTNPKTVEEVAKYYSVNKDIIKSEAIKEFAERLKCKASILRDKVTGLPCSYTISNYDFNRLVKEMVG